MRTKCRFLIACLLLLALPFTAAAQTLFYFPCEREQFMAHAADGHTISWEIDLRELHCMDLENRADDVSWEGNMPEARRIEIKRWAEDHMMIESGCVMVLDKQLLIVDLHFSASYDDEANLTGLPEELMFINHDPNVGDETGKPYWQVTVYPDEDDPYAFHYVGTYNRSMIDFKIYGFYTNPEGEVVECFNMDVYHNAGGY